MPVVTRSVTVQPIFSTWASTKLDFIAQHFSPRNFSSKSIDIVYFGNQGMDERKLNRNNRRDLIIVAFVIQLRSHANSSGFPDLSEIIIYTH